MDERRIGERGTELAAAIGAGDGARIEALSDPDFWARDGREDAVRLGALGGPVVLLGVLGRRTLLRVAGDVFEQLWTDAEPPLVEDQRRFTLVSRDQVESIGDPERIELLQTKLDSQDAATRLVDALRSGDEAAAAVLLGGGPVAGVPGIRDAELIGSVGPRTLVRLVGDDGEQTVEFLWRRGEDGLQVAGARAFGRPS